MDEPESTLPIAKPGRRPERLAPPDDISFTEAGLLMNMLGPGGLMPLDAKEEPSLTLQPVSLNAQVDIRKLQQQLPQYQILSFLARGGMGAVYKGIQRSLERTVAIKILLPGAKAGDRNFVERFKQEAREMARFKHPGIVAVHDAGETPDGLLYFVMEFIEGTDVAHMLARRGNLPQAEALTIAVKLCEALEYAHGRGVIHRDIKPSNVMIDADGTLKVADFGLAKAAEGDAADLTRSNVAVGTPDYIAPEALLSGINTDHRVDIYAVGVMLYQMLTGQIPRGRFDPPSTLVPGIDPRLDVILDRAMRADRDKRHPNAASLRAELESVAAGAAQAPAGLLDPGAMRTAALMEGHASPASSRRRESDSRQLLAAAWERSLSGTSGTKAGLSFKQAAVLAGILLVLAAVAYYLMGRPF